MVVGIAGPLTKELINVDWREEEIPDIPGFPLIAYIVNGLIKRGIHVIVYTNAYNIKTCKVFYGDNLTLCIGRRTQHPGRNFFAFPIRCIFCQKCF